MHTLASGLLKFSKDIEIIGNKKNGPIEIQDFGNGSGKLSHGRGRCREEKKSSYTGLGKAQYRSL